MSQTMEQTDAGSIRGNEDPDKKQKSRRPPNTAFRQQRLKAWQPILTPKTVLPLFFVVGIIFAPIGGLLLWTSAKVQEISIDYSTCQSDAPQCDGPDNFKQIPDSKWKTYFKNSTHGNEPTWCKDNTTVYFGPDNTRPWDTPICRVQFYIPDVLAPPVLLYYQLTNFYQNHRRYVKSFDQNQLDGKARTGSDINGSDCDPLKGELQADGKTWLPYYPCGLIANSLFNDTYSSPVLLGVGDSNKANETYTMTNSSIAWSTDADLYKPTEYKYGEAVPPPNWRAKYPAYNSSFPFPDLHTDEPFQVWMRTAGLPTFSKLALRNDDASMKIGRYEIDIQDYFPVTIYDGTKSILISTHTVMGGRNPFLGTAYVIVGGLCVLAGALFTVTQLIRPRGKKYRKLGDHSYLSWNNENPSTAITSGRAPRPGETA
ncbi:Lem3/Cdc50 [Acrodontium crateriforme]|uniref:Lem3/Cdc50 n=1 Tax=Acrodontium crateriforme TaxID=150365 RepID=A0AAQ3M9R1_9PEZI|nr:Lem3/Cdc50 [Acrodontium crateriforme]